VNRLEVSPTAPTKLSKAHFSHLNFFAFLGASSQLTTSPFKGCSSSFSAYHFPVAQGPGWHCGVRDRRVIFGHIPTRFEESVPFFREFVSAGNCSHCSWPIVLPFFRGVFVCITIKFFDPVIFVACPNFLFLVRTYNFAGRWKLIFWKDFRKNMGGGLWPKNYKTIPYLYGAKFLSPSLSPTTNCLTFASSPFLDRNILM